MKASFHKFGQYDINIEHHHRNVFVKWCISIKCEVTPIPTACPMNYDCLQSTIHILIWTSSKYADQFSLTEHYIRIDPWFVTNI